MIKVIWHLPFAMIGGTETLYETILKYFPTGFEHHVTCHKNIHDWVNSHMSKYASIHTYSGIDSLAKAIGAIRPDVVIGTHGHTLYAALGTLKVKYPVIETVHGSHVWSEHNSQTPKEFTKHLICVSKSAEEVYLNNAKVSLPTSVIINGVDTERFYPRKPFSRSPKNLAYFGRMMEGDKHISKIISAFAHLSIPQTLLYLIGGSIPEISAVKKTINPQSLSTRIRFTPHHNAPEIFYKEVDVCTVRSEIEGYCNSAAEALASGTPLVCYNFRGILEHLDVGTVRIANNQAEYVQGLRDVFLNMDLRRSMREKGLSFIQTQGNAKITSEKYAHVIRKIIPETHVVSLPIPKETHRKVVGVATPHWQGIYTATKNIVNNMVDWDRSPENIVKNICALGPTSVVFSGMPDGFDRAAMSLRSKYQSLPIYAYYHGGYSHFSFSKGLFGNAERKALDSMLQLLKSGVFNKLAVSSPGLAEVLQSQGYKVEFCGNVLPDMTTVPRVFPLSGVHIGNWNREHDHKHTSIGLAAGMLIPESQIHMLHSNFEPIPGINYARVRGYKEMTQASLYELYQRMTVNVQLSFIETFNVSVLEMWALGCPVLVGPGNYVLIKDNPFMKAHSYVEDVTNAFEVAKKLKWIIDHRDVVIEESKQHSSILNDESRKRWELFL